MIGASGVVGSAVLRALGSDGVGTYRTRAREDLVHLDARNAPELARMLDVTRPDIVFVPAAEPNVEWCEAHPVEARERNLEPLRAVLDAAAGRRVIGFSSDYVFDGRRGPYAEDSTPTPISAYGRIKVELEELLLTAGQCVIRTTTVFGIEAEPAKNFVARLVTSLRRHERVLVPFDQISTPTYAGDLGAAALALAREEGIWHVAGPDLMPRTDLAMLAAEAFGEDATSIVPVSTEELGQLAPRPLHGGLTSGRFRTHLGVDPVRPTVLGLRAMAAATEGSVSAKPEEQRRAGASRDAGKESRSSPRPD